MVKSEKITVYKVTCPACNKSFKTEKTQYIQCGGCGKRFDL